MSSLQMAPVKIAPYSSCRRYRCCCCQSHPEPSCARSADGSSDDALQLQKSGYALALRQSARSDDAFALRCPVRWLR